MRKAKSFDSNDIVGQRFGKWTVLSYEGKESHGLKIYKCVCDCGKEGLVTRANLIGGSSTSCGCSRYRIHDPEKKRNYQKLYRLRLTRTYRLWANLKSKCNNPNHPMYEKYEGMFPDRWNNYNNFLSDMGEVKTDYTIVRLDVTKPFSKENCRFDKLVRGKPI